MTLHLVFSPRAATQANPRIADGDTVVLLGDGVYLADGDTPPGCLALNTDLAVRGLEGRHTSIGYEDLVDLCVENTPVVSWR